MRKVSPALLYAARGALARVGSLAATFAMTWIVYRTVATTPAGVFIASTAVLTAVATIARFGLESLTLKLSAADPGLVRPHARAIYGSAVVLSAAGAMALFGFLTFYIHRYVPDTPWWAILALSSVVVPLNLSLVSGALLRGIGRVSAGSVAELGSLPALTFVGIAALVVLRHPFGLGTVMTLFTVAAYVTAAWCVPMALRGLRRESEAVPATATTRFWAEHHHSLRQFMITGLGYYLFANVPVLVLAALPDQSALFGAARTLATLVGTVPTIQISYLGPRFAHLFHRHDLAGLNRLIRRSTLTGTLVAGLLALPLVIFPAQVLHVYKPVYAAAAPTLQILAAATLLQVIIGPVQGLLVTTGFERQAARITMIMLVAGTLGMAAVAAYGAWPVAAVNALANLGFVVAGAVLLRRREGIVAPLPVPLGGHPVADPDQNDSRAAVDCEGDDQANE